MRQSPPTRRVTSVLDVVAAHPGRALTLAELVDRTDVSKATCLGIVNELCAAGYLLREGTAYVLGPALLSAGAAAQHSFPSLPVARPYLARLADDLHAACTASAVVRDEVVVLARTGDDRVAPAVRAGQRFPFAPPSGVMFVAWEDDATVEAWLSRTPLSPGAPSPAVLREAVEACRRDGYLVEALGEFNVGLYTLLARLLDDLPGRYAQVVEQMMSTITQQGYIHYLTEALEPRRTYPVSHVCAPVYDAHARMELLLAVFLMRTDVSYEELRRYAGALVDATRAITRAIGGHDPWRMEHTPAART